MTEQEALALPKRELDALVGMNIFGWEVVGEAPCWAPEGPPWTVCQQSHGGEVRPVYVSDECDGQKYHEYLIEEVESRRKPEDWIAGHHRLHCLEMVPHFTDPKSMDPAWQVVEKMGAGCGEGKYPELGPQKWQMEMRTYIHDCGVAVRFLRNPPSDWMAGHCWEPWKDPANEGHGPAPLAISIAALKVLEVIA